jgi:hypothetical protein
MTLKVHYFLKISYPLKCEVGARKMTCSVLLFDFPFVAKYEHDNPFLE